MGAESSMNTYIKIYVPLLMVLHTRAIAEENPASSIEPTEVGSSQRTTRLLRRTRG